MEMKIGVIKGDGIGPEIVREARKVLDKIGQKYGHTFEYEELLMGGCSIDVYGESLTDETLEKAKACDSILLGAVGGNVGQSNWYQIEPSKRPEAGLLKIRKGLGLYANIRPAILFDELSGACPLKPELTEGGFDFVVMRELTGGLYFGERKTIEENGVTKAIDTLSYDENFNQIKKSKQAIEDVTKTKSKFFQAPSGAFGDDTVKAANDLGYICYKWDVDTIDWMDKDNPDKIIQRIQKKDIKDGSIVLMHPTKATSICLDEIISIIRTRGYVPGKLSDVFE